mgnify:CR=1 FL=1
MGFGRLVNEAHMRGFAVILDYNHVGSEGNYVHMLGPYFSTRYKNALGP